MQSECVTSSSLDFRRDRFWRKLSCWMLALVLWKKIWMRWRPVKRRMRKKRSQRECRHQSHTEEVIEIWTGHAGLHLHATDAAAHLEDGADHLKDEVHHPDVIEIGTVIAAKVPVDIAADPRTEGIAPNLQVTTEVTGIAVTPSPQKVGQRRVTREVEEEMSDLSFLCDFFFFPFLFYRYFVLCNIWRNRAISVIKA